MNCKTFSRNNIFLLLGVVVMLLYIAMPEVARADLKDVKQRGVLRHLGVTYAHFVKETPRGYGGRAMGMSEQYGLKVSLFTI